MTLFEQLTKRSFFYNHRVYFHETNAMGGVSYFSNYIKWQGITREEYFIKTVPNWKDIMNSVNLGQLNMITVEEHSYFIQHSFFGDEIKILLTTCNIKRFSFDMIFTMFNQNNQLLYEGLQRLAFDNFKGKFVEIPPAMCQSVKSNEINPSEFAFIKIKDFFLSKERVLLNAQ